MKKTLLAAIATLSVTTSSASWQSEYLDVDSGDLHRAYESKNRILEKDGHFYQVDSINNTLPDGFIGDSYSINLKHHRFGHSWYPFDWQDRHNNTLCYCIDFGPIFDLETMEEIAPGVPGMYGAAVRYLGTENPFALDHLEEPSSNSEVLFVEEANTIEISQNIILEDSSSEDDIHQWTIKRFGENQQINSLGVQEYYSKKRGLYIIFEPLNNPEVQNWWREHLACSVDFSFRKSIRNDRNIVENISQEEKERMIQAEQNYANAFGGGLVGYSIQSGLMGSENAEAEEMISRLRFGIPYDDKTFEELLERYGEDYVSDSKDLLSAFRGFEYNLNLMDGYTGVVYASVQPSEGKTLYEKLVSPSTSDVIIAMTMHFKDMSGPLGIYRTAISKACSKETGASYDGLSPLLHTVGAHFVKEINPPSKTTLVRPLGKMSEILENMGVLFVSTSGHLQSPSKEQPYILNQLWNDNKEIDFGNAPLALVDPGSKEIFQIPNNHWVAQNPFLGGREIRNNSEIMRAYPFLVIDHKSLMAQRDIIDTVQ